MTALAQPIDLKTIKDQITAIEDEMKSPLPTPPIGTPIVWHPYADTGNPMAAIVSKVEGPGKISCVVFRPFSMPEHKRGVLHSSHKIHANRTNTVSRNSGSWGYIEGTNTPKAHHTLHLEQLTRNRDDLAANLENAKTIKERQEGKA